ncbi:MAG: UDP-N-acetylglucosamine 2-epimerase (hydrolyzing) [Nitrospira sp.]|nr:UDP-N-acetylglucosamine 2-epimerase (hydrolyzing) [Nitrospira sp.]
MPDKKKKICVITGTRAEYGLFYPLLCLMKKDAFFSLRIIATGMHLSPAFGLTYREIESDGFHISERVEMLLATNTDEGMSKSVGLGIISMTDALKRLSPDLVLVLGDRYETFAAAAAAFFIKIPVVHLHGGELTEGAMDDAMRHSITKISWLHFTSTEQYANRVIQLGEDPGRVFNVGAVGLDNIHGVKLMNKRELERVINFKFQGRTAIVTYHPVTLEAGSSENHFRAMLDCLHHVEGLKMIFTMPNSDPGSQVINDLIVSYVSSNPQRAVSFTSMGRMRYLSAMKYSDLVIGNSSSGLIEAPSFGIPTVNIGDRQRGRVTAESVISCGIKAGDIKKAIRYALSDGFMKLCKTVHNPYGSGKSAPRIMTVLKKELKKSINLKKMFYDLERGDK